MIADLRKVNKAIEKIKKEDNVVTYGRLGSKEKLQLVGIVDASYKTDEKSVAGMLMLLANEDLTRASPIFWKSKQIECICHSSKDAETLAMSKMVDEITYTGRQIETVLFGDYEGRMPIKIYSDNEPILESIASTRQVDRKNLRTTVQDLKERLRNGEIKSYQWLPMDGMWADGMTKEKEMSDGLRKLMKTGTCEIKKGDVNKVVCENGEIKMRNIRNRKEEYKDEK